MNVCVACGAMLDIDDERPAELPPGYHLDEHERLVVAHFCDDCGPEFVEWLRGEHPERFE
jgi:hypothetical protein